MHLLIDADLIAYEASSAAEMVDEGHEFRSFDYVIDYLDNIIHRICEAVGVDSPTALYLTGQGNFRYDIATVKPYKGQRKDEEKPFYLEGARKYLEVAHGAEVVNGMEADDMLTITASKYKPDEVCIASRDKDLRQMNCWQYSWESGKQPEWGPTLVDYIGDLDVKYVDKVLKNGEPSRAIKKISGTGLRWFYTQCIVGDSTDNIPGLEGKGASLAYELLNEAETEEQMFRGVLGAYEQKYSEKARERLLEQGRLLWMCRDINPDGSAKMWELPFAET